MHRFFWSAAVALSLGVGAADDVRAQQPLTSTNVITQAIADAELQGAVMTMNHVELAPGALLTNPHSHPGDLFGYILEGAVLTGLEHGEPMRYEVGEIFYEPKGILHTHFQNASDSEPARVLVVLLTKPEG